MDAPPGGPPLIAVNLASTVSALLCFVLSSFFPWERRRQQLALISCHRPHCVLRLVWGQFSNLIFGCCKCLDVPGVPRARWAGWCRWRLKAVGVKCLRCGYCEKRCLGECLCELHKLLRVCSFSLNVHQVRPRSAQRE